MEREHFAAKDDVALFPCSRQFHQIRSARQELVRDGFTQLPYKGLVALLSKFELLDYDEPRGFQVTEDHLAQGSYAECVFPNQGPVKDKSCTRGNDALL